jgi:hypothetical protein
MTTSSDHEKPTPFLRTPGGIALIAFVAIAGFFLWQEHRAHVLSILPYLLLLACPLLHVFMHRGHGGHGNHGDHRHPGAKEDDR